MEDEVAVLPRDWHKVQVQRGGNSDA